MLLSYFRQRRVDGVDNSQAWHKGRDGGDSVHPLDGSSGSAILPSYLIFKKRKNFDCSRLGWLPLPVIGILLMTVWLPQQVDMFRALGRFIFKRQFWKSMVIYDNSEYCA